MLSILTAFTSVEPQRIKIWDWVQRYYADTFSAAGIDYEYVVTENHDIPFNKAKAINEAVRIAKGDVFLMVDADLCVHPDAVKVLLKAMPLYNLKWGSPYNQTWKLSEMQTAYFLTQNPEPFDYMPEGELDLYIDHPNAGWFMVTRSALDNIGGMDERFDGGWGSEDTSTTMALGTFFGRPAEIDNKAVHLWHPMVDGVRNGYMWPGQTDGAANYPLAQRYLDVAGDKIAMRNLLDEK